MKRADRQRLAAVIEDVQRWAYAAAEVRYLAWHSPLSWQTALDPDEEAAVSLIEQTTADLGGAEGLTKRSWFAGREKQRAAADAAERLTALHGEIAASARDAVLEKARDRYRQRFQEESLGLSRLLEKLTQSRMLADQVLQDTRHMPLTREGLLPAGEIAALKTLIEEVRRHDPAARRILDQSRCNAGTCPDAHSSAAALVAWQDSPQIPALKRLRALGQSVRTRLEAEQAEVRRLFDEVSAWPAHIETVRRSRAEAPRVVRDRVTTLLDQAETVTLASRTVRLLPVIAQDTNLVAALRLLRDHRLTPTDQELLRRAEQMAAEFVPVVKSGFTARWQCAEGRCADAHTVVPRVHEAAPRLQAGLDRLVTAVPVSTADLDRLAEPSLGLLQYLPRGSSAPELLEAALMQRARTGVAAITNAARAAKAAAAGAKSAADTVRAADVAAALRAMDVDVLRKASPDKIRVAPLTNAGLDTVSDVLKFGERNSLSELPGLGAASAVSITQAALRLFEGVRDESPVRIDVKRRGKHTTALLQALQTWDAARRFTPTEDEVRVAKALQRLFKTQKPTHVLAIAPGADSTAVGDLLSEALNRSTSTAAGDVWTDFLSRPADYFGMLTELGFVTEDEAKMHGDLPEEIVEAVRAKELRRDHLTASLRTYQSFGARFALVQRKVVIGDEMGLGKTIEALAVLAHLRTMGESHFLVVCPAAVVSNWVRETSKHTRLGAHRLHGSQWERRYAAKTWVRNGGVAIVTYDLLQWASQYLAEAGVAAVVFDEAHYIKNPLAKRSQAAGAVIQAVPRALLLTGTPLENSVQEFRNLIGYLRPDLAQSAPEFLPAKFRKHVAPAYLRRNQEDVLTELPELVEVEEWMGLSAADERAYRDAVEAGHFMLMRRAAMLSAQSMKVARLIEIVDEAEANDRRVIVFSYFREVLAVIAEVLPGQVFGPLTGSLPATERQRLVDRFSSAAGGSVLVAQIHAGGVGLNIQAASVVVICEPQLKPTMEAQAVARAHRMGQVNSVQVHRMLTEDSVDERILEILSKKRQLFDEFARDSVIAKRAPDAIDVSDAELARIVIAAERERLFGQADLPQD